MRTQINTKQILDRTINKDDIDISTPGKALVTQLKAGDNIILESSGVDEGTGIVKISAQLGSTTNFYSFVKLTNTQSCSSGSYTVVNFNKTIYSENNFFDTRHHFFDIPKTGYYFINVNVTFNYYLYQSSLYLYEKKHRKRILISQLSGSYQSNMTNSLILKCTEGEQYQIQVYLNRFSRYLQKNACFAEFFFLR